MIAGLALLGLALLLAAPGLAPERRRVAALQRRGRLGGGARRRRAGGWARRPAGVGWLTHRATVAAAGLLVTAAGVTVGATCAPLLGVAAALLVATAMVLVASAARARAAELLDRGLVTAVRSLVADLQAGARPALALQGAAAVAHAAAFEAAARAAAVGGAGGEVADVLAEHGLAGLAQVWRVSEGTGAPLAEVLGRLSDDLTATAAQRRAVAVALAGPRSSALLLAGLPALGVGLGAAMGANPVAMLIGTPAGQLLCCVGVGLDVAGVAWTSQLIRRARRR